MTPWAALLLRPIDATDDVVRRRFHELARACHPDTGQEQAVDWDRYSAAYAAVKTAKAREAWLAGRIMLSGLCKTCRGVGVVGGALRRPVSVCQACNGEGRVR